MADQKSKLPDVNEVTSMATKLFRDVKRSIMQIIDDYKSKHSEKTHHHTAKCGSTMDCKPTATQSTAKNATKPKAAKPKTTKSKAKAKKPAEKK